MQQADLAKRRRYVLVGELMVLAAAVAIGRGQVLPILPALIAIGALFYRALPHPYLPDGTPRPLLRQAEIDAVWARFMRRVVPVTALALSTAALWNSRHRGATVVLAIVAAATLIWGLATVRRE